MVNRAKETKREVNAGGKEGLVSGMLSVRLEAAASRRATPELTADFK